MWYKVELVEKKDLLIQLEQVNQVLKTCLMIF